MKIKEISILYALRFWSAFIALMGMLSPIYNYNKISTNIPLNIIGMVFLIWVTLYFDEIYQKKKEEEILGGVTEHDYNKILSMVREPM